MEHFYVWEYDTLSEQEYFDEYHYRSNPNKWREDDPSDPNYVFYTYSLDQAFEYRDYLLAHLSRSLSDYQRAWVEHRLRAVGREIRHMKLGPKNETISKPTTTHDD
jgi:hypothetical protein